MNRKARRPVESKLSNAIRAPRQWWAAPFAFLATLLALPVNAGISIPDDPLTTASRVAPNILFILDDSGSMAFDSMPDDVPNVAATSSTTGTRQCYNDDPYSTYTNQTSMTYFACSAYTRNAIWYNPAVSYQPWMKADGNRMTAGTSYGAVYGSFNRVGGSTIDLADTSSCIRYNFNTNATNDEPTSGGVILCGGVQTFYVPKDTTQTGNTYLSNASNYYRYQILTNGQVMRSEYLTYTTANTPYVVATATVSDSNVLLSGDVPTTDKNAYSTAYTTVTTPANTTAMSFSFSATNGKTAGSPASNQNAYNLYVKAGSAYSGSGAACSDLTTTSNSKACTVSVAASNTTYFVNLRNVSSVSGSGNATKLADVILRYSYSYTYSYDDYSATAAKGCDVTTSGYGWRSCTQVTPTGRTEDAERTNYATWYSYHRTRMKSAKYGASEAFKAQGNKVRVGFRTIWERAADHANPIPVNDGNEGRFVNNPDDPGTAANEATTTRNTWYSRMQAVIGSSGTPLHGALENAGQYFQSTSDSGPYGPAPQYSCRQNFTILTTDGYWNSASNYDGGSIASGGGVAEQDNSNGSTYTSTKGQTGGYTASAPYASSYSNTLADVAMKYWKTDLRTLDNNVPTTPSDPAFWQHMVTFGISIGLSGNTGYQSVGSVPANFNGWPNPFDAADGDRIDDLLHAAVNGHGAFVSATNPTEFTAGLTQALATIAQRTASYSNVATNSTSLNTGAQVFSASYTSGLWTGSVTARAVTRSGVSSTVAWTASIPAWATRKIITSNGSAGATFPTTTQEAALARSGGPADYAPLTGAQNANYIKGDQSKEESQTNGLLRNRSTLIGDIVGSSPAYVKDTNTLYVGANDGMMHAFNAATGAELFAYVPNIINFNYLSTISRGDYTHKFFVDGPIAVSPRTLTPGKNILVGTLGRGGKGLYALDVSTPGSFGTSSFKWERNATGTGTSDHMGLVLGMPILAKVRNGSATTAVVLGNGPNSANDKAVLVVLDMETGSVIRQIDTGVGSSTTPNGLFAPTGIYAADGQTLAYVYAGDMLGNLWKFDLTNSSPSSWTATKLFSATSSGGAAQPITSGVTLAINPLDNKRWVFFGTGRFLTTSDADDKTASAQSMYAVMDEGTAYTRSSLTQRSLTTAGSYRAFSANAPLPAGSKGWYVDLPGAGERIVQDAQVVATFLITASMVPEGDACEASGTGFINAVDLFTGTAGSSSFFDLDGDGQTDDTDAGGAPIGSVNLGVGMPTRPILLPGQIVVGGTGDGSAAGLGGAPTFGMQWQRVSWREIRQD